LDLIQILKSLPHQRVFVSESCVCCGSRIRRRFPVIWSGLSKEWELTPELHHHMDRREGTICAFCRANSRSMHLAATLLDDLATRGWLYATVRDLGADAPPIQIAEINEIPGVHKHLSLMRGLTYSEYGTESSQDLMALTYADQSFDYVLTSDTLEHVPDFDLALREIRRVLKPQGKHIFTIPIIWDRPTRRRASQKNGAVVHYLPPSFHGNEKLNEYLVFNEFGGDVVERIKCSGFDVRVECDETNPLISTIVAGRG
jgi:SAM-dependent methyltransferase